MVTKATPSPEHILTATQIKSVSSLRLAVDHAVREGVWVAVVVPLKQAASELRSFLPAMLPTGSKGGGRTALLPGGGRVSIAASDEPVFVPDGTPLTIMLVGWGAGVEKDFRKLGAWRNAATNILDIVRTKGVQHGR